jgi:ubiquinone/menaquinone biosynthesis C-methylase UbiE
MKADHYDSFAESYSTENESSLLNAYYERPAMIDLAGDVNGRRVLDAGCGSGPLSAALRAKGAIVTGFDSSSAMVELARQRLGENAALHVADLSQPLPFADGAFDDVVASLVLHYLRDWAPVPGTRVTACQMGTTADRSRSGRPPHSLPRGVRSSVVTATGTR